ncbi:MAG: T9SS type A sorting domain-containing protein [Ignavibacteriae bacterium]|nr:T9SS type A sorting domain-containing protein [Ignavibacteriota bacterium]
MRFVGLMLLILLTMVPVAMAQYPQVTVRQIQEVPLDSLLLLDTLQCNPPRWTLQVSPHYRDTVTLTGVCVVPARVLDYTASGFNLLLADMGSLDQWGGILVRPNTTDTAPIIQWGILNVHAGDIIRFVGYVDEFPAPSCASTTQIVPILTIPLQIIGTAPVPPHKPVQIAEFSLGEFPVGQVRYSTGERYEFMRVLIRDAFVISRESGNCVLGLADSFGNVMYTYRARPSLQCPPYPIGARIDSVRGFILSTSGTEQQRVYRIAITDTNDVVVTDVEELERTETTLSYQLKSNYPNPFNPATTISFSIPMRSFVTLTVFDLLGREVSTLLSEELPSGSYTQQWNADGLTTGVYFYQLRAGSFVQTNKLVLLR